MEQPKLASIHARNLFDELIKRGVKAKLEYPDGHKTVDIAIPNAHIYVEVDGLQHFVKPEQIISDFKRSHFSDGDDFHTFYVTNQILENYLFEVADALKEVVQMKMENKF